MRQMKKGRSDGLDPRRVLRKVGWDSKVLGIPKPARAVLRQATRIARQGRPAATDG